MDTKFILQIQFVLQIQFASGNVLLVSQSVHYGQFVKTGFEVVKFDQLFLRQFWTKFT